jgi:hypothetical protein
MKLSTKGYGDSNCNKKWTTFQHLSVPVWTSLLACLCRDGLPQVEYTNKPESVFSLQEHRGDVPHCFRTYTADASSHLHKEVHVGREPCIGLQGNTYNKHRPILWTKCLSQRLNRVDKGHFLGAEQHTWRDAMDCCFPQKQYPGCEAHCQDTAKCVSACPKEKCTGA